MGSTQIRIVLEDPNVMRFVRYLGAFKVVEGDLGLFDELAKAKDIEQFVTVINKFLRVKDRVIEKLAKGIEENEYTVPAFSEEKVEAKSTLERVRKVFDVGSDTIKRVLELAEHNPRLIATVISSLALAYSGVREVEKKTSRR